MKKSNKKIVLSTAAVLGVAALAAGGTIAYFTDKKETTNRFTVGDVKISLYESQLHRQNSGRQGSFGPLASDPDYCDWNANEQDSGLDSNTGLIKGSYEKARYCTPLMNANEGNASTIAAVAHGHTRTGFSNANRTWGYKDETIEADAEDYKKSLEDGDDHDGYFTRVKDNIVPGQWVRKFTYVKNNDASSNAYVLIRYMIPTDYADKLDIKIPGTPYEEDVDAETADLQPYFYAVDRNETTGKYSKYVLTEAIENNVPKLVVDEYDGYTQTIYDEATQQNVEYQVYAAVTAVPLEPGEMTYWSPINTVRLKTTTTNTDSQATTYVAPADQIDIKVDAQAIQAKTFSSAIDAINNLE